jgi:hypothetical protein
MTMQIEEMRLDGNAAAGMMSEIFVKDVTSAEATCAGCGSARAMASLLSYGQAMGVVLRCPGCGAAMLRMVRTPRELRVDAAGIALLVLRLPTSAG